MRSRLLSVLFMLGALFAVPSIHAQVNTSTISGAVSDESGSGVPNAKVTATIIATGQQREAVTNDVGEFVLPQLPPGGYRIAVTASGFQTGVVENLTLNIAERATINVVLKLGQVSEQVTVEATAPVARTGDRVSRTGDHTQGDQRSASEWPQLHHARVALARRDSAAARKHRALRVSSPRHHSAPIAACWSAASAKARAAICTTASRCATHESGTAPSRRRSTRCRSSKFSATSFRQSSATRPAIINVASRGGTNQFHGTLFHFLRNDTMDARNFFSPGVEPFKRNQFGGAGGGFIKKDKIFVYRQLRRLPAAARADSARHLSDPDSAQGRFHRRTDHLRSAHLRSGHEHAQPFRRQPDSGQPHQPDLEEFLALHPGNRQPRGERREPRGNAGPEPGRRPDRTSAATGSSTQITRSSAGIAGRRRRCLPPSLVPLGGSLVDTKGVSGVAQLTSSLIAVGRQRRSRFVRVHDLVRQAGDGGSRHRQGDRHHWRLHGTS